MAQLTWVNVVQILLLFFGGGTMVVTGIKVIWNLISQSGRIDDKNHELERAIADRDYFRDLLEKERASHDQLKVHWKNSVIAQREARRIEESIVAGEPSVPPLSVEEPTGRFFIDEASDQEYRRQSEERRMTLARERDDLTRKYNQDMTSTPPDPHRPVPPRRLPKFRP